MDHKRVMIAAARAAGKIQLTYFDAEHTHKVKDDTTIVTIADEESEKVVIKMLTDAHPYAIISEESGASGDSAFTWVIDPVDGTHNFARGIPMFGISIALVHHDEPIEGVIYLPASDELYYAAKGKGAELNGKPLRTQPAVNPRPYLVGEPTMRAIPFHTWFGLLATLRESMQADIRVLGACVYGLSQAAVGRFDAYFANGQSEWDLAAGALIAAEAGCAVTTWDGKSWRVGEKSLLAARPETHERVLRILSDEKPPESL